MPLSESFASLTKNPGELIKSSDWNTLLGAIDSALGTVATDASNALAARAEALTNRINNLDGSVSTLQQRLDAFLGSFLKVSLSAAKESYLLGETVVLTVKVTDHDDKPIAGGHFGNRPWVDLLATWGRLSALPGFDSRGGVDDRSIRVRTNAEGIAQVRLRPEHAEKTAVSDEDVVSARIAAVPAGSARAVAQIFMDGTSAQAEIAQAYATMTTAYDDKGNKAVQSYVDAYYTSISQLGAYGGAVATLPGTWHDYRTLVLASASADADPKTPDCSRGMATIQVSFRDWIGPWIVGGYRVDTNNLTDRFRDQFQSKIGQDYAVSSDQIRALIEENIKGLGRVTRDWYYVVMHSALGNMTSPHQPAFVADLIDDMQGALRVQAAIDRAPMEAFGMKSADPGLQAFTSASKKVSVGVGGVDQMSGAVTGIRKDVDDARAELAPLVGLATTVSSLQGRYDALLTSVSSAASEIGVLSGRFDKAVSDVGKMSQRLDSELGATGNIGRLSNKVDQMNSTITTVNSNLTALRGLDVAAFKNMQGDVATLKSKLVPAG